MSEQDRTHMQWQVPPAAPTDDPRAAESAAPAATRLDAGHEGLPMASRPSRWRRMVRYPARRGRRGLVAVAVGLTLGLGGGAAGVAVAADGGPAGGGALFATDDDRGGGDRGDADRGRGQD